MALLLLVLAGLPGCQTPHAPAYLRESADGSRWREVETRYFSDVTEERLLAACGAALQDLGFNADRTDAEAGVLMASKRGSALRPAQVIGYIALALLIGDAPAWDSEQEVRASLIVTPQAVAGSYRVRLTLQREVFDMNGRTVKAESVHDEDVFRGFFDTLAGSLFYEEEQL